MSLLPGNSTFLPVLDDLLSPDFRTVSLPGQTPQTPAETPVSATGGGRVITFVESHTGQLTSKTSNYPGIKDSGGDLSGSPHKKDIMTASVMTSSIMTSSSSSSQMNGSGVNVKKHSATGGQGHHSRRRNTHSHQSAAIAIQQWWKVRRNRRHSSGDAGGSPGSFDVRAERAKHSIRHSRTEDHVRFLEAEVHRLKSALATERKLRSLQVEAIRSLWSQVQKVTTPSQGQGQDVMSQSMPNGLPLGGGRVGSGCMSMSVQGALGHQSQSQAELSCSCSKEIQDMKESFSSEMTSLRKMIDQLKIDGSASGGGEDSKASNQKRPLTLNLSGNGCCRKEESSENVTEGKKEITGYAEQMASSIIEDAKESEDNNE